MIVWELEAPKLLPTVTVVCCTTTSRQATDAKHASPRTCDSVPAVRMKLNTVPSAGATVEDEEESAGLLDTGTAALSVNTA